MLMKKQVQLNDWFEFSKRKRKRKNERERATETANAQLHLGQCTFPYLSEFDFGQNLQYSFFGIFHDGYKIYRVYTIIVPKANNSICMHTHMDLQTYAY